MRFEHHPNHVRPRASRSAATVSTSFFPTLNSAKPFFPFTVQNGTVQSVRVKVDDELEMDTL